MKLRLLTKFLLFILLPSLIGLSVVAGLSYWTANQTVSEIIDTEMALVVDRQQSELGNLMTQQYSALRLMGSRPEIEHILAAQLVGDTQKAQAMMPEVSDSLNALQVEFPLMNEIGLLDTKGTVLFHSTPKLIGMDFSSRDYFRDAMQGRMGIQSLRSVLGNKQMSTLVALPLRSTDGNIAGVIYGNINTAELSNNTTTKVRFGESGICYVYDANGVMIMHPNLDYIGDEDGGNDWTRLILTEKNGQLRYMWDNKVKLAHFRSIPNTNWIVVLAVERDELMAPIVALLQYNAIVVALCALIVGLLIYFTARHISTPLTNAVRFVAQVAEGNLDISPTMQKQLNTATDRGDEIGGLACGIGAMVNNLRTLFAESRIKTEEAVKATEKAQKATVNAENARLEAENARHDGMLHAAERLDKAVRVIASASHKLAEQIGESEHGARDQAARITETATAMNEMNATVLEVARAAGTAADVAAGARTRADAGTQVVGNAVRSIKGVQTQSAELKRHMEALGESAQSISQIMGVISDIADQTNLLALNAAIEAARAGDAGRGFAVVADEVRKLAEKTMVSTVDVGNAIRSIQHNADKSIAQMEEALHSIEEAAELSVQSGEALGEIASMVDSAADQVRAIATAAEEQSASSDAISRSIEHINDIAGKNSDIMRESTEAVTELSRQSGVLSNLISDLKKG